VWSSCVGISLNWDVLLWCLNLASVAKFSCFLLFRIRLGIEPSLLDVGNFLRLAETCLCSVPNKFRIHGRHYVLSVAENCVTFTV